MKIGMVLCVLSLLLSSITVANAATIDLYSDYGGYNLIAVPNVPLASYSDPAVMFSGMNLDGMLSRLNPATQSDEVYSAWDPAGFGGMLLGEGYWLTTEASDEITYDGVSGGVPSAGVQTDMWISLPGNQYDGVDAGGTHIIGNPYAESVNKSHFFFTDGVDIKNWADANSAGWVGDAFQGYEGSTGSSVVISLSWGDSDDFAAARAYYLDTFKDNLAMIIIAPDKTVE